MIHALVGTNSFQIQARLRELKADFIKTHGQEGVEAYSGAELTTEAMQEIAGGVSLFATHRFIVVKYLSENKLAAEQLPAILDADTEETTIVFIEGILDKRTAYYKTLKKLKNFSEYNEPSEQELSGWIRDVTAAEQATITPGAVRALLAATGADQARLSHELAKLTAYTTQVDEQAVYELVEPNPQDNIFALLDAALGGRRHTAQQLLSRLEEAHEDPFQIANMLIWQVHILAVVASGAGVSDADIAKQGKISPYVVKKTRGLVQKTNTRQLKDIIDVVARLDISLKTSATNPWHLLHHTVLSL